MQWMSENSGLMGSAIGLVTLLVWGVYLQLFYNTYRRQRRATILVNRGAGLGKGARCLVSNMSAEPVYVLCILARLDRDGNVCTYPVTDLEPHGEGTAHAHRTTHQGPLLSGHFMDLGTFSSIVDRVPEDGALAERDKRENETFPFTGLEIEVIAKYGSSDSVISAKRRFEPREDQERDLRPATLDTIQFRSRRRRREVQELLDCYGR